MLDHGTDKVADVGVVAVLTWFIGIAAVSIDCASFKLGWQVRVIRVVSDEGNAVSRPATDGLAGNLRVPLRDRSGRSVVLWEGSFRAVPVIGHVEVASASGLRHGCAED